MLETLLAAFLAGAVSSVGPCVAGRFVAIVSIAADQPNAQRWSRAVWFVGGVCLGYLLLGAIGGAMGYVAGISPIVYAVLGAAFTIAGVLAIVRADGHVECVREPKTRHSNGAVLLAGCASAVVPSPCCTPVVALMAAGAMGWASTMASVASFALGHALPLLAAALGTARLRALVFDGGSSQALATVGGALMVALGGYYAVMS